MLKGKMSHNEKLADVSIFVLCGFIIVIAYCSGKSVCLFRNIFHIPCPSCGLTRAFICIISGNLKEAFYYNAVSLPLFFCFLCAGIWIVVDCIKKDDSFNRFMHHKISNNYIFIIAIITVLNWIWNIKKGI